MVQPDMFIQFYTNNHQIFLLQNLTNPPFILTMPTAVAIAPLTFKWSTGTTPLSWQQIPLQLCYAITIHKSQWQKAIIDIDSNELTAGKITTT